MVKLSNFIALLIVCLLIFQHSCAFAKARAEFDVKDFGAVGDGIHLDTPAIQAAIDKSSRRRGAVVDVPPGRFVTGSLILKSGVTLHLSSGAVLLGSLNVQDYQTEEPFVDGTGQLRGQFLIGAFNASDIAIEGGGTIDGRGHQLFASQSGTSVQTKPFLLRFVNCRNVTLRHVYLVNSAAWTVNISQSSRCLISNVTILSKGESNNDGIDLDSTSDAKVIDCDVTSGDDSVCLKTTATHPTNNIVIRGCKLNSDCAAFKVGTESMGDFKHISFSNCTITHAGLGGIDIFSVDGANIDDVRASDIKMTDVMIPIFVRLGARLKVFQNGETPRQIGSIGNLSFKNIKSDSEGIAAFVTGLPGHDVTDISLDRVNVILPGGGSDDDANTVLAELPSNYPTPYMFGAKNPAYAFYFRHAQHINIKNCLFNLTHTDSRPGIALVDAQDLNQR